MTLVRTNGIGSYLPNLVDRFFNEEPVHERSRANASVSIPPVNIKELENQYELEIAVPGYKKDDFKVNIEDHTLTVSGESKMTNESEVSNYSRKEFSYSSFSRSFTLPENKIKMEKVDAEYQNGILKIKLPKLADEQVNKSRLISVK
ncbi:MAG: Hsp20/alpha crystallin family protein [Cyclobacteriaceae bacterium]|nr:Hsp20/alpha crystallin family protein [Cyclobacteriaceae bacterium]MCH8515705.1 Hsp20/alpha crystallin family protein [Cyclobacteriaceae bacterium]